MIQLLGLLAVYSVASAVPPYVNEELGVEPGGAPEVVWYRKRSTATPWADGQPGHPVGGVSDLLADGFGPVALALGDRVRLYGEQGPIDVPLPGEAGGLHRASDGGVLVAYASAPWLDHLGDNGELLARWPLPCANPARAAGPKANGEPWFDCHGAGEGDIGTLVSPDGRFVAEARFHRGPSGPVLVVRDRHKEVEVVRLRGHFVWEPAWDPTGRFLAGVIREQPPGHPGVSDSGQHIPTDSGISTRGPSTAFRLVIIDLFRGEVRRTRTRRIRALAFSEAGDALYIMRKRPVRVPLWHRGWQPLVGELEELRSLVAWDRTRDHQLYIVDESAFVVVRGIGSTREVLPIDMPPPTNRMAFKRAVSLHKPEAGALDPSGEYVATFAVGGTIALHSLDTGRLLWFGDADAKVDVPRVATPKLGGVPFGRLEMNCLGQPRMWRAAPVFSQDSRWMATGGESLLTIWDVDSGEVVSQLVGHSAVEPLAFDENGTLEARMGTSVVRVHPLRPNRATSTVEPEPHMWTRSTVPQELMECDGPQ